MQNIAGELANISLNYPQQQTLGYDGGGTLHVPSSAWAPQLLERVCVCVVSSVCHVCAVCVCVMCVCAVCVCVCVCVCVMCVCVCVCVCVYVCCVVSCRLCVICMPCVCMSCVCRVCVCVLCTVCGKQHSTIIRLWYTVILGTKWC